MHFGDALTLLKAGHKLERKGWNGKGMWVELQTPDSGSKMTLPYLFLSYPDGRTVPWLASQTDMLEEDWMIKTEELVIDQFNKLLNEQFDKELAKIKKPHWTQTPEGKKIMAKRKRRSKKA